MYRKNTHKKITIIDPDRWYLKFGERRKHYVQLHASYWSDSDFLALSNGAKVLFLWILNQSLRVNKASLSVPLDGCYVFLNCSLNDCKQFVNELKINNFIDLDGLTRKTANGQLKEENKRKKNKTKKQKKTATKVATPDGVHIDIINYLNKKTGKHFKHQTEATKKLINSRLKENFTIDDFKAVIDCKTSQWKDTDMGKYLRPSTLFGNKFESYVNEVSDEDTPEKIEAKIFKILSKTDSV